VSKAAEEVYLIFYECLPFLWDDDRGL